MYILLANNYTNRRKKINSHTWIHGYMDNRRVFSASQHTKVQAFSPDSISIYTLLNNTTMITVIARVIKDAPIGNWANGPSVVFGLEVPDEFPKCS